MNFSIRPIREEDIDFLWEMLYQSLYVPEGQKPFERSILQDPYISKYMEGWGRAGDFGFIAENEKGQRIGSITARCFDEENKGFGYIANDVPELGMALLAEYRGNRIGTALMNELIQEAKKMSIKKVSLSVDPGNEAAMKLYERFGFKVVGKVDTSFTMVVDVES